MKDFIMSIRNGTPSVPHVAVDPSEYLRKTINLEKPMLKIVRICPPEVLRRIYRRKHKSTGAIADNHS